MPDSVIVNRGLDSEPGNPYSARFGPACSPRWWAAIDRGELPVEVLSGVVSLVGARPEPWSDEPEDVVEFVADGQAIAFDRVDHWAAAPICVGDRITVTRTVTELATRTGPVRYVINLRAEWVAAEQRHASPGPFPLGDKPVT